MSERQPRYRAWLLRCWEVGGPPAATGAAWRFSLEDPQTGTRHGFASLAGLIAFVQVELAGGRPEPFIALDGPDSASRRHEGR